MNWVIWIQTVLSTVAGSAVTLIITHFLRDKGKISCYIKNVRLELEAKGVNGILTTTDDISTAEYGGIDFHLELYNPSEVPKAIRELKILFCNEVDEIYFSLIPQDKNTESRFQHYSMMDDLNIINIQPKNLIELDLHSTIGKNMGNLKKVKIIYLEFEDIKGKRHRKLIKSL